MTSRGGMGAIIRDHERLVLACLTKSLASVESAAMAEAYAVREALTVALECGFKNLVIGGDAKAVIDRLNHNIPDNELGLLLLDAKELAKETMSSTCSFVYRDCNESTNRLAIYALSKPIFVA